MAKRINGRLARPYVQQKMEFKNSNGQLYGQWSNHAPVQYGVYSYGTHWPLFIYVRSVNTWFENKEKYGPTTSKHRTQTPPHCDTVALSLEQMHKLDAQGYNNFIRERLTNG